LIKKYIIADASPLIAFGRINHLVLLTETLGTLIVPESVLRECLANPALTGAKQIQDAVNKKLITWHEDPDPHSYLSLFDILGPGEANAIILANELKVGLLIDEKLGRKIAQKMNLSVIGTAGVLLLAKEKKLIKEVMPLLSELKKSGYYLSNALIQTVLAYAKEAS
jgi:predicted nucleic acid-binding protein